MNIGETLSRLRKERGYTQQQVAGYLSANGCEATQKAVSKWERGFTMPNAEQFLLLCRFYGVRDVLAVFCEMPESLSELNALGKKRVEEYIRLLSSDAEFRAERDERPPRLVRTIPLYSIPASAGTGQFLDSSDYELIEVDESVPLSATFAVKLSGDSMLPRFGDGQVVYVKPQQTLERRDIGIFLLNGNAYCKQLGGEEDVRLISLNRRYEDIIVDEYDEFRVLGKVVG
ncbi:MAG TPA: LexA family transcriptional regulator [Papillibacter sp.]|nr:LexA family transcriptional regulator [Papillibacter sp.]